MTDTWTAEDAQAFLDEREPHTQSTTIYKKNSLLDRIEELQSELGEARKLDKSENRLPESPRIEAEIEELRQEYLDSAQRFTFRELPRARYEKIQADHPPRKDEPDDSPWNVQTFPPALFAAASYEPRLSEAAAKVLWGDIDADDEDRALPFTESRKLFNAVVMAQSKGARIPLAVSGTGKTRTTEPSSSTAALEESPEASS